MTKFVSLSPSSKPDKKYVVKLLSESGREKHIHFGAKGMDDFTKTKDEEQKRRYIIRHERNEDWTNSGLETAGFWARWILWNKPSISASLADVKSRFNL